MQCRRKKPQCPTDTAIYQQDQTEAHIGEDFTNVICSPFTVISGGAV